MKRDIYLTVFPSLSNIKSPWHRYKPIICSYTYCIHTYTCNVRKYLCTQKRRVPKRNGGSLPRRRTGLAGTTCAVPHRESEEHPRQRVPGACVCVWPCLCGCVRACVRNNVRICVHSWTFPRVRFNFFYLTLEFIYFKFLTILYPNKEILALAVLNIHFWHSLFNECLSS